MTNKTPGGGIDPMDVLNPISTGIDILGSIGNWFSQQQQIDYMKEMQKESWAREDNAVQRRVRDLKAAGLSPVLAAGSAASASSPINVGYAQMPTVQDKVANMMAMMRQKQDIAQSSASTELMKAQKAKAIYDSENTAMSTGNLLLDSKRKEVENEILTRQLKWDLDHGVRPGTASGPVKDLVDAVNALLHGGTTGDIVGAVTDAFGNVPKVFDYFFPKKEPPKYSPTTPDTVPRKKMLKEGELSDADKKRLLK